MSEILALRKANRASTAEQREAIATLATLEQAVAVAASGPQSPAPIVIGDLVDLHGKMRWFAAAADHPPAAALHH